MAGHPEQKPGEVSEGKHEEKSPERTSTRESTSGRQSRRGVPEGDDQPSRESSISPSKRKSIPELKERQPGERPHFRICYLCKREFGSQSYPIHIPQCQKKWLLEEAKKPEHERRRLPQPPYDEEPIVVGLNPPQEDNFGGEEKAAFEASLAKCEHCGRLFVPKALQHHSSVCTEARPGRPAGTALNPMSFTNRLVPGEIAGTQHATASAYPHLSKKISLFTNWKILSEQRAADPNRAPCGQDPGQSSRPKSNDPCDDCGTRDRPDSKYCSSCGKRRPAEESFPSSPPIPKEEHQDVVIAWVGKSSPTSPDSLQGFGEPSATGGRETPISLKDMDKLVVQSSDSPVEIVIQLRPSAPPTRSSTPQVRSPTSQAGPPTRRKTA